LPFNFFSNPPLASQPLLAQSESESVTISQSQGNAYLT
jgi:hypothetical protein